MVEPYLGEIKLFSYTNIPRGWRLCDGGSLPVAQNQALYALIGNIYGGNTTAFNVPDMRGRVPVGATGTQKVAPYGLGTPAGQNQVVLTVPNLPPHNHNVMVTTTPGTAGGANNIVYAQVTSPSAASLYGPPAPLVAIEGSTLQPTGGNAGHNNMQPFMALVYCIATQGVYPPQP